MKTAVRYYTRSGNTKKLAEAIAEAVGTEAKSTDGVLLVPCIKENRIKRTARLLLYLRKR